MVTNQPGKLSVQLRLLGDLGGGHESSALQQLGKTWPGETEAGGQQNVDLRLRLMIGEHKVEGRLRRREKIIGRKYDDAKLAKPPGFGGGQNKTTRAWR